MNYWNYVPVVAHTTKFIFKYVPMGLCNDSPPGPPAFTGQAPCPLALKQVAPRAALNSRIWPRCTGGQAYRTVVLTHAAVHNEITLIFNYELATAFVPRSSREQALAKASLLPKVMASSDRDWHGVRLKRACFSRVVLAQARIQPFKNISTIPVIPDTDPGSILKNKKHIR